MPTISPQLPAALRATTIHTSMRAVSTRLASIRRTTDISHIQLKTRQRLRSKASSVRNAIFHTFCGTVANSNLGYYPRESTTWTNGASAHAAWSRSIPLVPALLLVAPDVITQNITICFALKQWYSNCLRQSWCHHKIHPVHTGYHAMVEIDNQQMHQRL